MPAPIYHALYFPAHKNLSRGSTVGGITPELNYLADWLCDDRSGRPVRTASLSSATLTFPAAGTANFAALINSNLTPGATATFTVGGETAILTVPPAGADGISRNPWGWLSAPVVGASSASIAFAGHSGAGIIGEVVVGELMELGQFIFTGGRRTYRVKSIRHDQEFDALPDYDLNVKGRDFSGQTILRSAGINELEAAFESQRGFSRPIGLIPDYTKNDFWWGRMTAFTFGKRHPELFDTQVDFSESGRWRW